MATPPQIAIHLPDLSSSGQHGRELQLFFPVWATAISASIFLFHRTLALEAVNALLARVGIRNERPATAQSPGIGAGSILVFRAARLIGCLGLLALSFSPVVHGSERLGPGLLLSVPYLYTSVLAALSVSPKSTRHRLIRHANAVLFLALCVYVYRDILPLATFAGVPADRHEGRSLWAKIALLFITAVIIPLFTPRQYIPVDPLNPAKAVNPELTASVFSFIFFLFLDRITLRAYRESRLHEEELYPLCDTDGSAHLKNRSFKYLDGFSGNKSQRHIFFGLMRFFRREVAIMAALLLLRVLTTMSGPFAMNRLLQYIETQEQGATVRPWVWILIIVLGPVVGSITFQFYLFISTRSLVRAEAIITQLVFAHSLRIRVKAETTSTNAHEVEATPSRTPTASTASTSRAPTPENPAGASRSSNTSPTVQGSVTSSGKSTSVTPPPKPVTVKAEPMSSGGSLVGKINNLVTVDLSNITDSRELGHLFIVVPLQIVLAIWFLYVILGWSVWVGVASIVLLAPVPGYMAKLVQSVQKERLKRTDERVQSVSEDGDHRENSPESLKGQFNLIPRYLLISFLLKIELQSGAHFEFGSPENLHFGNYHIRYLGLTAFGAQVKLFGWEEKMNARIGEKVPSVFPGASSGSNPPEQRDSELVWIRKKRVLDMISTLVNFIIPTELLDNFDEKNAPVPFPEHSSTDERVGFRNASFSWSKEIDGSSTPSQRQFLLRIDGELFFERGRINLVVGPTGSGKTSLLMALLGEMHWIPSSPDSWYNLPRDSGVAYAAQESWVLNETIRSNILFDTPFDEERYKKILYQCALEPDIALFQAGDQSEVGEKGLTLSGGQKARLTLARAVYSRASILLLDDVLAALDVHTAQWIVEKCFGGDLIENRTVILVILETHNVALARPIADFVVTFGSDGRIRSQGTISELTKRGPLAAQIRREQQALDETREEIDAEDPSTKPADGKLIVAEEIQLGHVGASAVGGKFPLFFFTFFLGTLLLQQVFVVLRTWILGYWATQYDQHPAEDVNVVFFLSVFVAIAFFSTVAMSIAFIFLVFGQLRASKVIHTSLLGSVFSAPLRWLDITPTSRILARATNDVRAIDDSLPATFWPLAYFVTTLLIKFVAVLIYTPIFFVPGALVGALGAWIGQIFIAGQLPVKRLMSNARAPVLAHFTAAMAGLVSIRAFGAESKFRTESLVRIDRYTRAARNYYNLDRWVGIRIDMLGSVFFGGLAVYLVYIKHTGAGDTGFVLNMSIAFTQVLLWVVKLLTPFAHRARLTFSSLERIQAYIDIEHEKPATDSGKPPAYWPASGELRVEGLSARYSNGGPKVLHDISFHIKAGERVSIGELDVLLNLGRTGSGKSSLTLSLLRCIPTEGSVMYDGLETSELNLDALRSSITIIPQVPELLSGTLRANLDPFGQYDDAELNDSLRAAGLFALQDEMDEGRITLDSAISTGGSNLSIGQRQIFALARAILRRSKILILDEATSAIDYKTDSIIQNSLRHELRGDVSLITVAHRLQTIMDADKIMVLDAGRIVEFDTPKKLLKIKDGKLRALVEESGDRDALYAMAGAEWALCGDWFPPGTDGDILSHRGKFELYNEQFTSSHVINISYAPPTDSTELRFSPRVHRALWTSPY
ncbi:hypothetical protein DFH06DRAFT_1297973 [Mycena polygramma]|nr:hypothetical protein DFH06DRAFT_1297973 [Mycena polygramma]